MVIPVGCTGGCHGIDVLGFHAQSLLQLLPKQRSGHGVQEEVDGESGDVQCSRVVLHLC